MIYYKYRNLMIKDFIKLDNKKRNQRFLIEITYLRGKFNLILKNTVLEAIKISI